MTLLTSAALLLACSKAPDVAAPAPKPAPVAEAKAVPVAATQVASIAWVKPEGTQIDRIFAQAKADNKPVFLYWGAVWCPPCNQIKATVFNRPDFVERSKLFVPVYLDGDTPGAQKLAAQFKVRGYPTMILFKPDGTEVTRLPGEVDAAQYMQVLGMGLVATHSVKDSLNAILTKGTDAATLAAKAAVTSDAWRLLAYYSWDTDEARLLPKTQVASALQTLSQTCPPELKDASNRLALKAMALAAQEKLPGFDRAAALKRVQLLLADPALVRDNFDMLAYYANDIVPALAAPKSAERAPLATAWNAALDRLAADATLSKSDRLTAVYAKVALTRADAPKGTKPPVAAALVTQAHDMVTAMNTATTDKYERQAVIPGAADLLSEVGLLDESDALLNAELPKAVSPSYHMLVLAANAKTRGDKAASLNWSEKAYDESVGAATRLQWGTGYVGKLLDLSPQDAPRIERAATKIIAELEATPETFYERNRRSLERMGSKLNGWNVNGTHSAVLKKLNAQMAAVCAKLPAQDEAAQACGGVFKAKPARAKA